MSQHGATVSEMFQLTTLVRSLGNHGAIANVRSVLEARRQEDWVVASLSTRLNDAPTSAPAASASASGRAA